MPRLGSKEKIRQFLLANIGRVVESHELQAAAGGAVQYSRRLRELREQEGWKILSQNDRTDLKPGQYLLEDRPPAKSKVVLPQGISAKLRAGVVTGTALPVKCAGFALVILTRALEELCGFTLGTSKTKGLVARTSYPIFALCAQPAIKARKISHWKSRVPFGCCRKSGEPDKTNRKRSWNGSARSLGYDGHDLAETPQ